MLHKLLGVNKLTTPFSKHVSSAPAAVTSPLAAEGSSLLKIIHVGGVVECYYMPVPAVRVMQKYPSFVLARPEVFRRPWDSLVHPEEILMPGQRFFVVPRRTIQKLRRRMQRQNSHDLSSVSMSFSYASMSDVSSRQERRKSAARSKTSSSSRRGTNSGYSTDGSNRGGGGGGGYWTDSSKRGTHSGYSTGSSRRGGTTSGYSGDSSRRGGTTSGYFTDFIDARSKTSGPNCGGASGYATDSISTQNKASGPRRGDTSRLSAVSSVDQNKRNSLSHEVTDISSSSTMESTQKSILARNRTRNTKNQIGKPERKRKVVMWNPTLTAIHEASPARGAYE